MWTHLGRDNSYIELIVRESSEMYNLSLLSAGAVISDEG